VTISQRLLRNQRLRNVVPPRLKAAFAENRVRLSPVTRRSDLRNVYHCCLHKTGSQWVRKVLADPVVYRMTGLRTYAHAPRASTPRPGAGYAEVAFDRAFPSCTIVSPLYIPYANFAAVPKPDPWRAFFVARDPRDVVVSWYFSTAHSHPTRTNPGLQRTRDHLATLDEERGLVHTIARLRDHGLFDALASWIEVEEPEILLVKYEDLVGPEAEGWWAKLLDHCDIPIGGHQRRALLDRYSFEALSGRRPGEEDTSSKLRKGLPGDWRNHFTPAVRSAFSDAAPGLVRRSGYKE
jgi:hypothetical protein